MQTLLPWEGPSGAGGAALTSVTQASSGFSPGERDPQGAPCQMTGFWAGALPTLLQEPGHALSQPSSSLPLALKGAILRNEGPSSLLCHMHLPFPSMPSLTCSFNKVPLPTPIQEASPPKGLPSTAVSPIKGKDSVSPTGL